MDIVFVNGLVKSREKYLIEKRTFLQAAESESFSAAVKILKESGFGDDEEAATSDYEEIVSVEWNKFFEFLKKYSPKDWFLKGIAAKYDFFNAEYSLREKYAGAVEGGYAKEGLIKIADLKAYAKDGKGEVPDYLKKVMDEGKALFEGGEATGKRVSALFKRAYYAYMLKTVKSRDWKEFLIHEIDSLNLSVALRAVSEKEAEEEYIKGGKIAEKTLKKIISGEGEKAKNDLKRTEYEELLEKGLKDKAEGKSLIDFELAADDFPMDKLKEKRFSSEGITPLLLYSYYKINEIKNARIVLAAKMSGIGKEEIIRRLRSGYAG